MPRKVETSATITLGDLLGGKNLLVLLAAVLAVGGAWARVEIGLSGTSTSVDKLEKQSTSDHEKLGKIDPADIKVDHEKLVTVDVGSIKSDHEKLQQLGLEHRALDDKFATSSASTGAQVAALQQLMKSIEQTVNLGLPRSTR